MELNTLILQNLLDKYEKSKHLKEPNLSTRRVSLSKEKGELKGYQWENLRSVELFRKEVESLEEKNLISIEWEVEHKVISRVFLNLDRVQDSYNLLHRTPPWTQRDEGISLLLEESKEIASPWLLQWRDDHIHQVEHTWKLPSFLKKKQEYTLGLFSLLRHYDHFPETGMTLRSFSIQVFQNSKTLERDYLDEFLKICREYHPELSKICDIEPLSEKEQLLILGILPRREYIELSGDIQIITKSGCLDVGAVGKHGLAISGFLSDSIKSIDFSSIEQVHFIENKTNYEHFILNCKETSVVIYHGGFFSPSKGNFFKILQNNLPQETQVFFGGDMDLGGLMMFQRLKTIIPTLQPYQMGTAEMEQYAEWGLHRDKNYLNKVKIALDENKFPTFQEVLHLMLQYEVTIEQEIFLHHQG